MIVLSKKCKCKCNLFTRSEMSVHSSIELEFGNVGFWRERKTGVPGEKPLGADWREPTTISAHIWRRGPGIEPGTQWWKASALTTTPSRLPRLPRFFSYLNHIPTAQRSYLPLFTQEFGYNYAWAKYNLQQNTFRRFHAWWDHLVAFSYLKVTWCLWALA